MLNQKLSDLGIGDLSKKHRVRISGIWYHEIVEPGLMLNMQCPLFRAWRLPKIRKYI
jgi:hypothetical protein